VQVMPWDVTSTFQGIAEVHAIGAVGSGTHAPAIALQVDRGLRQQERWAVQDFSNNKAFLKTYELDRQPSSDFKKKTMFKLPSWKSHLSRCHIVCRSVRQARLRDFNGHAQAHASHRFNAVTVPYTLLCRRPAVRCATLASCVLSLA
jgi:hypothetical protein